MITYTKMPLSASTDGKAINVGATGATGALLHTAVAGVIALDEIWLYAVNSSAVDVKLTIQWGGVSLPTDNITLTIAGEAGLVLVIPGLLLQNALKITAYAATASVINIHGYVNRIATS